MIALISDVHSNLEAFEKVLEKIKNCELILNAGDIVDYNANPNEVIDLVEKYNIISIQGNHDYACYSGDVSNFTLYAAQSSLWTSKILRKEKKQYLQNLPKIWRKKINGFKIVMVHGSPRDYLNEYVYPYFPDNIFKEFLKQTKADILILGHTHIPFIKYFENKIVINPGSVGQPRDGNPKASYALLDLESFSAKIQRISYNFKLTAQKIIKSGLPFFLAERLSEGI